MIKEGQRLFSSIFWTILIHFGFTETVFHFSIIWFQCRARFLQFSSILWEKTELRKWRRPSSFELQRIFIFQFGYGFWASSNFVETWYLVFMEKIINKDQMKPLGAVSIGDFNSWRSYRVLASNLNPVLVSTNKETISEGASKTKTRKCSSTTPLSPPAMHQSWSLAIGSANHDRAFVASQLRFPASRFRGLQLPNPLIRIISGSPDQRLSIIGGPLNPPTPRPSIKNVHFVSTSSYYFIRYTGRASY